MNSPVQIKMSRYNALMLAGWINAHRPAGDWEPGFVNAALLAINEAVQDDDDA